MANTDPIDPASPATALLRSVREATDRLAVTVQALDPSDLKGPSRLPSWTRGHVLTHLARNADAGRGVILGLRSGRDIGMYASRELRNADIEAGSGRPAGVIIEDALESSRRFVIDAECVPGRVWDGRVRASDPGGGSRPAVWPLEMRLREVEFHHVDLDTGYTFADAPPDLLARFLDDTIGQLAKKGFNLRRAPAPGRWSINTAEAELEVAASDAALMAWLSGRSTGEGIEAAQPLPAVPSLG